MGKGKDKIWRRRCRRGGGGKERNELKRRQGRSDGTEGKKRGKCGGKRVVKRKGG
jgi:hypothetical protein